MTENTVMNQDVDFGAFRKKNRKFFVMSRLLLMNCVLYCC